MAASPSLACAMELIQGTDPEDARRILDPTIEAMMRAVHRYEYTVNKVLGRRHHGAFPRADST